MQSQTVMDRVAPLIKDVKTLAKIENAKYGSIEVPRLLRDDDFPPARWTSAIRDKQGRVFPQTIAHRGYRAVFPENSMAAFHGAINVGAHALETDMHMSKDGVVVLSHDGDLNRCFGVKKKIIDCDWDYLKTLRSKVAPHEPLARLKDLLELIARPGLERIWILLDIKTDNDPADLMRLIGETLASVSPGGRAWKERVILGCWTAKWVPMCAMYVPGHPITHIGASTWYAQQFFDVPNCSFNMLQKVLLGPYGHRFIKQVRDHDRELFVWTVNSVNLMKWSIQKEVDGVITDDPKAFKEICDQWQDDEPPATATLWDWYSIFFLYIMIAVFTIAYRRTHPETVRQYLAEPPKPRKR